MLAENRSDINKTVLLLQDTLANINDLTANLGEMMSQTNKTVRALPDDVTDMVDDLRDSSIEKLCLVCEKIITDVVKALFLNKFKMDAESCSYAIFAAEKRADMASFIFGSVRFLWRGLTSPPGK